MRNQRLDLAGMRGWLVLVVSAASLLGLLATGSTARAQGAAQGGQGKYVTEASQRIAGLLEKANKDGYRLTSNRFSVGGGWLEQGKKNWVSLYSIGLAEGKEYRVLAAGDFDARDVDVRILDSQGKEVASDTTTDPTAVVSFRAPKTEKYQIEVRLYDSRDNVPCLCLAIILDKR